MEQIISIDDQPMSATFFDEGNWLTDFITPDALDVKSLYEEITEGIENVEDRIIACWSWVANEVQYTKFVKGKLWINGKSSVQNDYWSPPSLTIQTQVGNCAVKSFLLCSLLRNELPEHNVYCVLGNLYNGKPGGHAWCRVNLGQNYIMETTRPDVQPLVPVESADRYEAVHLFNDKEIYAIEGRTVLEPFSACYSDWLRDYLDWSYIEGTK